MFRPMASGRAEVPSMTRVAVAGIENVPGKVSVISHEALPSLPTGAALPVGWMVMSGDVVFSQ